MVAAAAMLGDGDGAEAATAPTCRWTRRGICRRLRELASFRVSILYSDEEIQERFDGGAMALLKC